MLFVALARPELLTDRPTWGGGLPAYTALALEPLSDASSQELAEQLLAETTLADGALQSRRDGGRQPAVHRGARGLHRRAVDRRRAPDERTRHHRGAARLAPTRTSEASSSTHRSPGASSGAAHWPRWRTHDDLAASLSSLEDRGLIGREAVSRIKGDQQFAFKHALIHDVAYQTLPRAARRERHAAVARFLSATTASGQSHEALAHHWREAGEVDRAVEHLVAAADQASHGWAKEHAVALYTRALELMTEDDPRRRSVRLQQIVTAVAFQHMVELDVGRPTDEPS